MRHNYLIEYRCFGFLTAIFICCFATAGFSQDAKRKALPDPIFRYGNKNITAAIQHSIADTFDSTQINIFFKTHPVAKKYADQSLKFYRNRKYAYAWFKKDHLIEQAVNLGRRMRNLADDGVFVQLPYQQELDSLLQSKQEELIKDQGNLTLELLLTTHYFMFSKIVWEGMNSSVSASAKWHLPRKQVAYDKYLDHILLSPTGQLPSNEPVYRQYSLLKKFLTAYRALDTKEKWLPITIVKRALKPGDTAAVIPIIKTRLYKLGDYFGDTANNIFNTGLQQAVAQFQQRHGLKADSLPNKETIAALNVPLRNRITQILVNMERCRWLPAFVNEDYIAVNIPEFKLHVYHDDSLLWNCNVVVGKTVHQTSVFYGEIKYVVFSPFWNVPRSIVRNEIIPAINRNAGYIKAHDMEVTGHEGGLPVIRQRPGENNPLGLVKFLFPNEYNIYLHDTPTKTLFGESTRAFSHGCIRIAEPVKMANFLLKDDKAWDAVKIDTAMHSGKEQYVTLANTVPVFIAYVTAFVDRNNKLNFRNDIYRLDEHLAQLIASGSGVY